MSESIKSCATVVDESRRQFLQEAAELYGRPLAATLDELDRFADDTAAVLLAFPWMSDAELLEALWALDQVKARS